MNCKTEGFSAKIRQHELPYVNNLDDRNIESIRTIVIHCTETPDLAIARNYGEQIHYPQSGTGNSGHFYIDLDGSIEQYVPLQKIAHHVADHNHDSIGIELVNKGRWPDWFDSRQQQPDTAYPGKQITALVALLNWLEQSLSGLSYIAGHAQLDTRMQPASDKPAVQVYRKVDPGPMFPWDSVLAGTGLRRQ